MAVCQENNTCACRPFYQGDGFTCTGREQLEGGRPLVVTGRIADGLLSAPQ